MIEPSLSTIIQSNIRRQKAKQHARGHHGTSPRSQIGDIWLVAFIIGGCWLDNSGSITVEVVASDKCVTVYPAKYGSVITKCQCQSFQMTDTHHHIIHDISQSRNTHLR